MTQISLLNVRILQALGLSRESATLVINRIDELEFEVERLRKYETRLKWLHDCSSASRDSDGFEWGVYRVKFDEHGQNPQVLQTNADFSDLDAEMAREKGKMP